MLFRSQSVINLSNKSNENSLDTSITSSISSISGTGIGIGTYLSEEYDYPEIFNLIYTEKKFILFIFLYPKINNNITTNLYPPRYNLFV